MAPLKTRGGLENPYTIRDGDFITNDGRGNRVSFGSLLFQSALEVNLAPPALPVCF